MKPNRQNVERFLNVKYGKTPEQLFDQEQTAQGMKMRILNDVYQTFTCYKLTPKGLVHLRNAEDNFPNYNTRHLHSLENLMYDLKRTSRIRKRPINRIKMKWKKTKAKFKARKSHIKFLIKRREKYHQLWSRKHEPKLNKKQREKDVEKQILNLPKKKELSQSEKRMREIQENRERTIGKDLERDH